MIPLAGVAFGSYSISVYLLLLLRERERRRISDGTLREWLRAPEQRQGEMGSLLEAVDGFSVSRVRIRNAFAQLQEEIFPPIDRRLLLLNVFVEAAPLLGLLGTVLGMVTTFEAMAHGNGAMMGSMAQGISEALITTETGLLVAIPGYYLATIIRRKRREEEAYVARVESVVMQHEKVAVQEAAMSIKS
jgi:biopolymer transport protein ExbB